MKIRVDIDIDLSTSGTNYDGSERVSFSDDLAAHAPQLIDKVHLLFEDLVHTLRLINMEKPRVKADAD